MTKKEKQHEVSRLQTEMNNLIEKRIKQLTSLADHKSSKASAQADMKAVKKELGAIDELLREKLTELQKIR